MKYNMNKVKKKMERFIKLLMVGTELTLNDKDLEEIAEWTKK